MNNFKDYGFEGDFEGEILKEYENQFVGMVYQNEANFGCSWDKKGRCLQPNGFGYINMNLKPIKKEWYEKEDNFRIAVKLTKSINDFKDKDGYVYIMEKFTDKKGASQYITDGYHTPIQWLKHYRPATKEEVLSLMIKI